MSPQGLADTEALEPLLPIVDCHHHLWDRPGDRYLFNEIYSDINCGHSIKATVLVQGRSMYRASGPEHLRPVGETEFANGIAAMFDSGLYGDCRVCAGIVSYVDLRNVEGVIPSLQEHLRAGGGRFKGIRQIAAWVDDPSRKQPYHAPQEKLLADARFREGFAALSELGLSFETWLLDHQIDELSELAAAFPNTPMVLDHLGSPVAMRRGKPGYYTDMEKWGSAIGRLSQNSNVKIKFGGLGMPLSQLFAEEKADADSTTVADLFRPYFETVLRYFEPNRVMFESNFPVDSVSFSYLTFWNACKRLSAGLSAIERDYLFSRTATDFYKLALPAAAVN